MRRLAVKQRVLIWLLFFRFGAYFDALDVYLVFFAASYHFALAVVSFAASFEVFLVEDEVLFIAV